MAWRRRSWEIAAFAALALCAGCSGERRLQHTALSVDSNTPAPAISLHFDLGEPDKPVTPVSANRPAELLATPGLPDWRRDSGAPPRLVTAGHTHAVDDADVTETVESTFSASDHTDDHEALTWRRSLREIGPSLGRDVRSLANWETAGILALGGGASLAARETVDDDVRDWTAERPDRWGFANDVLSAAGHPATHFAAAGVLWGAGLASQNQGLHETSGAMINALILTNVSTLLLKIAADTDRPDGEARGWPSGHTSSSFTMAAVLDEYYGPWAGLAAYGVAGAVAFSRIDQRKHDLSDVLFGVALGYAVGKVVAANHHRDWDSSGVTLLPYLDPVEGTTGVALEKRF